MSVYTATQLEVYLLTERWGFQTGIAGLSGTRTYLDTTADLGVSKVGLPKLGDAWDSDNTNITLKNIEVNLLSDRDTCGKKYFCTYDGQPFGQTATPLSDDDVPRSVEVGGEYLTWVEPSSGSFYFKSDNVKVEQAMARQVSFSNFRMYRVISNSFIDDYMVTVMGMVNKLNDTSFVGFPSEMVMFTGANMTEFKNRIGALRWRVELNFSARSVTRNFTNGNDGWNYILRDSTGTWDKPVIGIAGTEGIYPTANFKLLFNTHALGSDENLFQVIPAK